ncbi:O-antigen polysaccharide polymerase Wzy [Roseobacteraceae bacterium S113]
MIISSPAKGGPGYMAAAEMYFNFHIPGVMLGHILLGYMIGRIHQTLAHLQANAHYMAATAVFFFTCLIWIRNEMSYVTQIMFLWGVLFWLMPRIGKTLMPWKSAREVRTVSAQ